MTRNICSLRLALTLLASLLLTPVSMRAQGTWTSTNSMNVARSGHTANLLVSGMVLVAGGENLTGGRGITRHHGCHGQAQECVGTM